MSDIKTKLDNLTAAIGAEAAAEAMEIIKDSKSRRKLSVLEAEQKIAEEFSLYTARRISEIRLRETRRVSARTMENKRKILSLREECLNTISGEVSEKVAAFTQSEEYAPYMMSMLDRAISAAGEDTAEARLYLRNEDLYLETELKKRAAGINLAVCEGKFTLGGLILEVPAHSLFIDMSFDTAFKELSGRFTEISNVGGRING